MRALLPATVRVISAEYSFGELARLRDILFDSVFTRVEGITSLDLDETRNRVTLGADPSRIVSITEEVRSITLQLGLDARAIEVVPMERFQWSNARSTVSGGVSDMSLTVNPQYLYSAWPVLAGGIWIETSATDPRTPAAGGPGNCSLGFTALYTPTIGAPYRAMVTASHCTAIWGAPDATTFKQAGTFSGTSTVDKNKYHCGWNWCRASDAALFSIHSSIPYELGLIVRTTFASSSSSAGSVLVDSNSPWFVVSSTSSIPVGWTYHKVGWVGGWTTGVKLYSCVDHHLGGSPAGVIDSYTTRCSDKGSAFNPGGDSGGSVFVRADSNRVSLIGTTVGNQGGLHVWSPFSRIESDMDGQLAVVRPATLATPSLVGIVDGATTHAVLSFGTISGASEYVVTWRDFDRECTTYGCTMIESPSQSLTLSVGPHVDTRTFLSVMAPTDTASHYTIYSVRAANPTAASFSAQSSDVRVARNGVLQ